MVLVLDNRSCCEEQIKIDHDRPDVHETVIAGVHMLGMQRQGKTTRPAKIYGMNGAISCMVLESSLPFEAIDSL